MLNTNSDRCWVIVAEDVEHALSNGLTHLLAAGQRMPSRAGDVIVAPCPVVTTTTDPRRRWLLSAWRDANPFFHLVEAAWMLAGRDDSASLLPYVKRFSEFAEADGHVHGAYGRRWRSWFGVDQLQECAARLRAAPHDRQAVIDMWDGEVDLTGDWKDRPCNTHAYLRVREKQVGGWSEGHDTGAITMPVLDLTVCCRSNDAVWGAHGANAVHFSYLLEYLASAAGVECGHLIQVSNNYHAYCWLADEMIGRPDFGYSDPRIGSLQVRPMGSAADVDTDLPGLWQELDEIRGGVLLATPSKLRTAFATDVLAAARAHKVWSIGQPERAQEILTDEMSTAGWHMACSEWIQRRVRATAVQVPSISTETLA